MSKDAAWFFGYFTGLCAGGAVALLLTGNALALAGVLLVMALLLFTYVLKGTDS